ncbi:MAG: mechanosensitive ion channel family protein [Chloroflexi bacterium]|mgnify:CR=1 FL=1|nr:mechanosensitive ion channel family protein [Chloroflexota bacterium]MBT7081793.1 mechanosensitive ion channel family protein [Chloroflexota bacterium]MBT7289053.1 mechanosensitive ion channel family protein [Chloroflexota bacterium]
MDSAWTYIIDNSWTQVLLVLAICFVAYFALRYIVIRIVIGNFVNRQMKRKVAKVEAEKRINTLVRIASNVLVLLLILVFILVVLDIYSISITASIAGLGVVGLAIGFGAQSLLQDWVKGFFILAENQYGVGDVIKVGGIMGTVEDITLRRTVLRDLDGAKHMIPHGHIGVVSNYTQEWSRANLNIPVGYSEDLDRVMDIMKKAWIEMAQDVGWSAFMKAKTPTILRVNEFGDSGIVIKIVGETEPIQQWSVMAEYRRRIKRIFDDENIEIPWPHVKVFFGNEPGAVASDK